MASTRRTEHDDGHLRDLQQSVACVLEELTNIPVAICLASIQAVTSSVQGVGRLRAYVNKHPSFLHDGSPHAPYIIQHLLLELAEHGVVVAIPCCTQCARPRHLVAKSGLCLSCNENRYKYVCDGCGRTQRRYKRTESGRMCLSCLRRTGNYSGVCVRCGRTAIINSRSADGALCQRCSTPHEPCIDCGRMRHPRKRHPEGPLCDACHSARRSRTRQCPLCRDTRIVNYSTGTSGIVCATCAGVSPKYACQSCGTEEELYGARCVNCELEKRLSLLFASGTNKTSEDFKTLQAYLSSTPNPRSILRWIGRSASSSILADLIKSGEPITHESLTSYPDQPARRIRTLLIAANVLGPRSEDVDRFATWIDFTMESAHPDDRLLVAQYGKWNCLPFITQTYEDGKDARAASHWQRHKVLLLQRLLHYTRSNGQTLTTLNQSTIDAFIRDFPSTKRALASILNWTYRNKFTKISGYVTDDTLPTSTMTASEHSRIIERLTNDSHIKLRTRVMGLFVALYGLTATRVVKIKRSDLFWRGSAAYVYVGSNPLRIDDNLAVIVSEYIYGLPSGDNSASDWLFPSTFPGLHIHQDSFSRDFSSLGFSCVALRNAARLNLASHAPVAVVAQLTGVGKNVAARWATVAGAAWATYPSLRRN